METEYIPPTDEPYVPQVFAAGANEFYSGVAMDLWCSKNETTSRYTRHVRTD